VSPNTTPVPGENPVTEPPGFTPTSPLTTLAPVLLTASAASTANDVAVPIPTGVSAAYARRGTENAPASNRVDTTAASPRTALDRANLGPPTELGLTGSPFIKGAFRRSNSYPGWNFTTGDMK
jgi:hypothetical protein